MLSNDFRHPPIVAHEAASLHLISGGRFELGIGAGWYQPEYDAAGIAFGPAGQRLARLDALPSIISAARHSDIVGIPPAPIRVNDCTPAARDECPFVNGRPACQQESSPFNSLRVPPGIPP